MKDSLSRDIILELEASIDELSQSVKLIILFEKHLDSGLADSLSRKQLNEVFESVYVRLDALQVRLARPRADE